MMLLKQVLDIFLLMLIFSKEWVNINKLNTQPQITPEQKREAQQKISRVC